MKVELEYCAMCGYQDQAVSLRDALVKAHGARIAEFKLVPARGGCFELRADGRLLYSKLDTGVFPDEAEMVAEVAKL